MRKVSQKSKVNDDFYCGGTAFSTTGALQYWKMIFVTYTFRYKRFGLRCAWLWSLQTTDGCNNMLQTALSFSVAITHEQNDF